MSAPTVIAVIIVIIAQLVALFAGQARFYALCLDVTLKRAYMFLFLPVITALLVYFLIRIGLLPSSLSDEIFALSSIVGQLGTLYAVYKLMNGSCSASLKVPTG